jgi:hypothetical protein
MPRLAGRHPINAQHIGRFFILDRNLRQVARSWSKGAACGLLCAAQKKAQKKARKKSRES